MRIYFSGGRGLKTTPEFLIPELKPHIMLTFHDISSNGTRDRLNVYFNTHNIPLLPRKGRDTKPVSLEGLYTESMFMDSGAFSLYNLHVRESVRKSNRLWPDQKYDYSYYSLKKGSDFRKYCDRYAWYLKKYKDTDVLWTTVDAIRGPETTWQTQQYFENEHGVKPVPVIHAKTDLRYVDRYIEAGKYDLIGLGGLGQNTSVDDYKTWASQVFTLICPKSNKYKPTMRVHGFAMTSSELIRMYPWWSVDSATWVKLSAYGWLYVPRWKQETKEWDFNKPIQFNVSAKSPQHGKHFRLFKKYDNSIKHIVRWLETIGLDMGSVEMTPEENKRRKWRFYTPEELGTKIAGDDFEEDSLSGHFANRSKVNLMFLKGLEMSRPKWPYPLNTALVQPHRVSYSKGFGF